MTDTPFSAASDRDEHGLSVMERRFCEAALDKIQKGDRHWRKQSALDAGYSEKGAANNAYELIRRPHVIAYLSTQLTEAAEAVKIDRSFVLFRALTNLAACEAREDYRTAHRYLDIIAKHADVKAFSAAPGDDHSGRLSLPFDPSALSTDELAQMIALMRKAAGGQPTE